jgi:hypothetical protein
MKTQYAHPARHSRAWLKMAVTSLLLLILASPALAQSTDRDNPVPLTTNEIRGEGLGKTVEHYYSLQAVPGEIKVTLDATATKEAAASGGVELEIFDEDARKLLGMFVVAGLGSSDRKIERIRVRSPQTLVVKLLIERGNDRYMVRLEGSATQLRPPAPPSAAAPTAAPVATMQSAPPVIAPLSPGVERSPAIATVKQSASSAVVQFASSTGADSNASAQSPVSFRFVNRTRWAIHHVYFSSSSRPDWGADHLGNRVIPPGGTFDIRRLEPDIYDIKTIDQDGDVCIRKGVPLYRSAQWIIYPQPYVRCVEQTRGR